MNGEYAESEGLRDIPRTDRGAGQRGGAGVCAERLLKPQLEESGQSETRGKGQREVSYQELEKDSEMLPERGRKQGSLLSAEPVREDNLKITDGR